MKKYLLWMLAACLSSTVMAQERFELGKPNNDNYRYLDEYHALKEYIDYSKYPNFKLGAGTTVNDYLNNSLVKNQINKNFTETVAGNAMKMASCVDGNGNMNFTTVRNYVNAATRAGLNVYGHTLAWHSQQPMGWLLKLMADKPAEELTDGDVDVWAPVASKDFRISHTVGWTANESDNGYSIEFDNTNGLKVTTTMSKPWEVQFVPMENILLTKGKPCKMIMTVKGSKAGRLDGRLGDWNVNGPSFSVSFSNEWKDVEVTITPQLESSFILLHVPSYIGEVYIKSITFEEQKKGKTIHEERRCVKVPATSRQESAGDNQFWLVPPRFSKGQQYEFTAEVRADKPAYASTQLHNSPGTFAYNEALGNIQFTTEWQTVTVSGQFGAPGHSIVFNLNELDEENNYYFDNVSLKIRNVEKLKNGDFEGTDVSTFRVKEYGGEITTPTIIDTLSYVYVPHPTPQTMQERHDTLVYAMDKWIKGMMNACGGKVKAWDLVNEAISGGGNDGEGNYPLQHSEGYNPNGTWDVGGDAFYWQDFMGDLEYVRQACRLARKYGPEDIVLFINDYNLESDWDGNHKLKSLINWIKKWEADGVTKIDGIGTQMHISYYENSGTQSSKKNAITQMFTLMAATGKWVRVSEMDMGYVNANGQNVPTGQMTETQHQNMANFYEWIIKEYLRIVPPEQQWGICQWCTNDSPSNSGWRANTPVGIWDLDYYRKHVYAGFVRGLGGIIYTGIDDINADNKANNETIDTSKVIYNLNGMRMSATSLDELPAGIYIVNGKKVVK